MAQRARIAEVRTENLLTELLLAQGWDVRRPPNGEVLRQHEYKDHAHLSDAFKGRSKSGGSGDGLPETVVVDRSTLQPLIVIEAKAAISDLRKAESEVTTGYGTALVDAGFNPLAVALAGTSEDEFAVRVFKWTGTRWLAVTYDNNPIGWIPNRADTDLMRTPGRLSELRPSVPPIDVLAARADEINRLLRESGINDSMRPAVVGAFMLALWQSHGNIRKDPDHILIDINEACAKAFWKTKKPDLAKSLRVDEANDTLAIKARRIVSILERLNVSVLTAEHDYLGQLYETFFRYTGGNTIGQYFTPRHIATFMAALVQVALDDKVLDPACGTGGFLVAAMNRVLAEHKLSRTQMVRFVKNKLIGYDKEPMTAALCVANMILRGDGSTGVHREDSITAKDYPDDADVVLMNPPFPHKKTDRPPEKFIERALEGLKRGGRMAVIVPLSLLVKADKKDWRAGILSKNTVEAAIKLPDELFQPYAQPYTVILILTKGIPHPSDAHVFFARIENDGYSLKKGVRLPIDGEQISAILSAYREHRSIPGFCGWAKVDEDAVLAPGAYIPTRPLSKDEVNRKVRWLFRSRTSFVVRYASELFRLSKRARPYREIKEAPAPGASSSKTIGGYFDIFYGQKSLHSKERLLPGYSLVISSSGLDNGCYGFFDFEELIQPPFVTVPSTGSLGHAHVQEWPCGVTDDCLLLFPKKDVPHELLYIAAAVIRGERWRFSYGRKVTPERIANFPLPFDDALIELIREWDTKSKRIEEQALADEAEATEDESDAQIAEQRLSELRADPSKLIQGEALFKRLAELEQ